MSVVVKFPDFSRYSIHQKSEFLVEAKTLGEAIETLGVHHPQLKELWLIAVAESRGSSIWINQVNVRYLEKFNTPLQDGDEILILFAIPGG